MPTKCNIISFGEINRYILFIFIGGIFMGNITLIGNQSKFFNEEKDFHPILLTLIYSLGLSLSFLILIIYKKYNKRINENKPQLIYGIKKYEIEINKKEKFLWILLVSIIDFIATILSTIFWTGENSDLTTWSIDIIFLVLFSYLVLKERLHKHNYVSIIIIMILGFLFNFITNQFSYENFKNNYLDIIFIFISQILYQFVYVLCKYLIVKKYIISYEILFYQGLIELILSIITLIITTNIGYLDNFWDYYNNLNAEEIIISISLIIFHFIYNLSIYIVIEKYSPFYVLLLDTLGEFYLCFIYFDKNDLIISILAIIIIFICVLMILIFVEIIQLNCFGLSFMTRKNIQKRSRKDSDLVFNDEDGNEEIIDYQEYIVDLNEGALTEMVLIDSKSSNDE